MADVQPTTLRAAGVDLHCLVCGPEDGELVILLHGFPEYSGCWRDYMPALAAEGYRVVAPDQRGYGKSDKPPRVSDYGIDTLTDDVAALLQTLGRERAHLVGHDWGAAVTWWAAHSRPELVKTATVMNVPHPVAMQRTLRSGSLSQMKRSWYILFFQIPWLPERALGANRAARLCRTLKATSVPGAFSDETLRDYVEAWLEPGALTGMLQWYRAAARVKPAPLPTAQVEVPLLMIWGEQDHALGFEMVEPSMAMVRDGRLVRFADATHWVNHEKTEENIPLLLEQFRSAGA